METVIEKVLFLQRIEMFEDIPTEQLAHVAGIANLVSVEKGEVLFEEGDPSNSLYLIIDGKIQLKRNEKIEKESSTNEAVGIWGFFDQQHRLVTAVCSEDAELLRIDNTDFFDLMEDRIHLSRGLLKYFVKQMRQLIETADTMV